MVPLTLWLCKKLIISTQKIKLVLWHCEQMSDGRWIFSHRSDNYANFLPLWIQVLTASIPKEIEHLESLLNNFASGGGTDTGAALS